MSLKDWKGKGVTVEEYAELVAFDAYQIAYDTSILKYSNTWAAKHVADTAKLKAYRQAVKEYNESNT